MNSVNPEDLAGELSDDNFSELVRLHEYLRCAGETIELPRILSQTVPPTTLQDVLDQIDFRYSPSIITRSEAELVGLSDPRFAIRACLKNGCGLLNLRRTVRFNKHCASVRFMPERIVKDIKAKGQWTAKLDKTPLEVIASEPIACIADSVLCANERLRALYHIVERDFALAYGETPPLIGTSYVRHIRFQGGGLCAQACSFIVAAMMQHFLPSNPSGRFQAGVHGIAEITAIAADDEQADLHLTGLTYDKIATYLQKIGLSAPLQTLHPYQLWGVDDENEKKRIHAELFNSALRSYAISGFPIVVPCVSHLLPWRKRDDRLDSKLNHAVVVVGCGRDRTQAARRLLVNDPSSMPFVHADFFEFVSAAAPSPTVHPGAIVAAVPPGVALSLWSTRNAAGSIAGLFDVARFVQTLTEIQEVGQICPIQFRVTPENWSPGTFQLVRFGVKSDPHGPLALQIVPHRTVWQIIKHAEAKALKGWYWIQSRQANNGRCYAIWNAHQIDDVARIIFPKFEENEAEKIANILFLTQLDKIRNLLIVEEAIT